MVLPGWNVSEPVELAFKLYGVVEALRSAPDNAKAFVSKINHFSGNLKELQMVLKSNMAAHSPQELERLRAIVVDCEACVKRCEEFSKDFGKLTRDGKGKMDGAGQAALWALQEKKKVPRLKEEVDGHTAAISLALQIRTLCVVSVSIELANQD